MIQASGPEVRWSDGRTCEVLATGLHSETKDRMVACRMGGTTWVMPAHALADRAAWPSAQAMADKLVARCQPETSAVPGRAYRHFKGGSYVVLLVARHVVADVVMQEFVVYRGQDGRTWFRPGHGWDAPADGKVRFEPVAGP